MNTDGLEPIRQQLGVLLDEHGIATERHENWLLLRSELPAIDVAVVRDDDWHPAVSQIDFKILAPDGVLIVESFGVFGGTVDEVNQQAVDRFRTNALHVVLAAFCNHEPSLEHVGTLDWKGVADTPWRAFLSGWKLTVYAGDPHPPPQRVLEALEPHIRARLDGTKPHWFRICLSTLGGQSVEVLWDNEPWPEAEEVVQRVPWAKGNQQIARCFGVVVPRR